jgi:BON domain
MTMRRYVCAIVISLALLTAGCTRAGFGGRTDQQVATDVQNKINADNSFPDKGLTASANNGVVTLSGNVSSDAARNAAANDAAQVEGVKTVVNNLVVAPPVTAANTEPAQQDQASDNPPSAPARTAAKSSPRTGYRRFSANATGSQNDSGGNGLRTTAPPSNDSAANAPPAAPVAPPAPQKVTIPAGTQLNIRLNEELSSEKAQVGDVFHGSISSPITIDDQTVIPTTADIEGRVVDVKSAGRFAGQSDLVLQLTRLVMNGKSYNLQTDQWSKAGSGRGKATAAKVGGGAAVGAILGGIFGGGKGAAIGAAAGAGAGTGVSAAGKGQQIVLKPEAVISFTLQNPITVTPGARSQPFSPSPSNN